MNILSNHIKYGALSLALLAVGASNAYATSSFTGSAALTFTYSGDLSGIVVGYVGSGNVDDGTEVYGDAVLQPNFNFPDQASGEFSVVGSVNDSEGQNIHSAQIATFALSFVNHSGQSRSFGLSLDYLLHAVVVGEFANSAVQISFGDYGYDELTADLFSGQDNISLAGSSGVFNFDLAANETGSFSVNVGIVGDLLGTTPVPLPAAAWSFLVGLLGLLGVNKKRAGVKID
ncbi:hypothetical protein [Methylomonas albis]|uniref:Uncharacterized protein n=1 Tax=Methylomonas albis TaxID=1854563 RepID=A0ABR9D171_9GAMM|nr:hypothetical protein [Methylomonas albis]MBD9356877.1 hypothetical protein [Methylomonas albis]CAD6880053.1 hypothetical protein [Methylomonas albis]